MMNYWENRAIQSESLTFRKSNEFIEFMAKEYKKAQSSLHERILNHLQNMADINNITLSEVKRMMNDNELDTWKRSLYDFVKASKGELSDEIVKELDTISKRVRISYLQGIETDLKVITDRLLNLEKKETFNALVNGYETSYYRQIYDLQRVSGYKSISALDINKIEAVINKPWAADKLNFSNRIWKKKDKLINTLHDGLTQNFIGGTSIKELSESLQKEFEVSKNQANRLIRTEMSAIRSKATENSYKDLGIEQYQILATLDHRTSHICQNMDTKILSMKDYRVGVTAPPFHVNCRTTTIPYIERLTDDGERMARDPVTGRSYPVDSKLSYKQWHEKYVVLSSY